MYFGSLRKYVANSYYFETATISYKFLTSLAYSTLIRVHLYRVMDTSLSPFFTFSNVNHSIGRARKYTDPGSDWKNYQNFNTYQCSTPHHPLEWNTNQTELFGMGWIGNE